jgi:hypothetical protein
MKRAKRAMKWVAVSATVLVGRVILLVVGWVVSGSWVTPFEKRAIETALTEIDGIRQYRGVDSEAYRAQIARATAAVAPCKKREITIYDGQIVWGVEMDLDEAVAEKKFWQIPDTNPKKQHALEVQADSARFMERSIRDNIR